MTDPAATDTTADDWRSWHEAGDGVFRKRFEPCDVTVTAVVGSEGVAVIDTRCSPAEAREIKDQLRHLTSSPVRWVVNTHAHFDHCWGNAEFVAPRLTPPAQIWGHESVLPHLDPANPALASLVAELMTEEPRWATDLPELEFAAPTELVHDHATIDLGNRRLDLRYLGRGHTDGDLWILLTDPHLTPLTQPHPHAHPNPPIALAGDLIEQSGPPAFGDDSFPLEWAATLTRALDTIGPDTIVIPGHGDVVDTAFVRDQRAAIDAVAQEIQRLHAAGVPVGAAASEGDWAIPPTQLGAAIARAYTALGKA
jgi:glyoxylase-like metal-dependent hydrolase (beta-lactamase superfamily II)